MSEAAVSVIFETHSTSVDNEHGLASGHADVGLSSLGAEQALALGNRYRPSLPFAAFCSDLKRSYLTAEIAFTGMGVSIHRRPELREVDYGLWTQRPAVEIAAARAGHVDTPFPGGESYRGAAMRVKRFLETLGSYRGKTVLVIGHRATQYALEYWLAGVPLEEAVAAPWQWQPGWTYHLSFCGT